MECVWCNAPSLGLRCSKCKVVGYCSPECQKQHWNSGHKGQCSVLSTNNQEYIQSNKSKVDELKFPTKYLFPPKRVAQMLDFKQNLPIGAGLHNIGNTCFMNAVLQSLVYTPGLTNYFVSGDHRKTCTIEGFCMGCLLEEHTFHSLTQPGGVFMPRDIFLSLKKIGDFQLLTQEDAHEFYIQVLDRLHISFLKNSTTEKVDPLTEGTTLMRQLFGGYLQNQVQCSECKSVSRTYEPFTTLAVSLSPSSTSVEQELLSFTSIERMPEDIGYKCEKCNKKVAADKQLLVRIAPPILALSLKRFDYLRGGMKIDKPLIFHNELLLDAIYPKEYQLENENYKYVLYALIVHFGASAYSGHYVAFVKIGDKWLLFDDAKVYEVSPATVLKQKAYMLFYKREKMDAAQHQLLKQQFQRFASSGAASPKPNNNQSNNTTTQNTNNPNNLNMANLHVTPPVASPPASGPVTPSYKVFYRNSTENSEEIVDFVLRVHLPLVVTIEKLIVSVSSQGSMKLLVPLFYHLDITIPFTLDTENSKGYFFQKNNFLFVVFPVCHDTSKVKPNNIVKPTLLSKDESPPVDLHVNSECEIDVSPNKSTVTKKPDDAAAKRESEKAKENEKQDESTYPGLYQHIRDWAEQKKKGAGKVSDAVGPQTKKTENKVGRNDTCPCGSGRKYKTCHGQS